MLSNLNEYVFFDFERNKRKSLYLNHVNTDKHIIDNKNILKCILFNNNNNNIQNKLTHQIIWNTLHVYSINIVYT